MRCTPQYAPTWAEGEEMSTPENAPVSLLEQIKQERERKRQQNRLFLSGFLSAVTFLTICVNLPLWYYVVYQVLKVSHVDKLVWFLFWTYVISGFILGAIARVLEIMLKKYQDSK